MYFAFALEIKEIAVGVPAGYVEVMGGACGADREPVVIHLGVSEEDVHEGKE